jgi:hypothetical protein
MGRRGEDEGARERRPVMGRIGVARLSHITPRESGQTAIGSLITRAFGQPTKEATQMSAACPAGAASHYTMDWQAINWPKVYRMVRRLQARLVKAEQAGRGGKVKALQRLLTHSFSGRALAVRRVTSNDGKRTPGVDGVTWTTPEQKSAAVYARRQHG